MPAYSHPIGVSTGDMTPPEQLGEKARRLEELGYSHIMVPEDYFYVPALVGATLALSATRTVPVGTSIVSSTSARYARLRRFVAWSGRASMAAGTKPVALLTVYGSNAMRRASVLQRILGAIERGPQPPIADFFVGTYGLNPFDARTVPTVAGCHYAPVFGIANPNADTREKRRLSRADAALVGDTAHAGKIPGTAVIPPDHQHDWGMELGRRFRDELRAARREGLRVDAWQFDEILSDCRRSSVTRAFVGGALRGFAEGRRELDDKLEKGFVWSAEVMTKALPTLPTNADVTRFLGDVDRATLYLVGEEYPRFEGPSATAGRRSSAAHTALIRKTGVCKALGQRYIVGLTPGWRLTSQALGGNVRHLQRTGVQVWRNGFIDARIAAQHPRGFAQYNFVKENVRPNRLEDAVASLHHACKLRVQ
jgi:hypothetical protein